MLRTRLVTESANLGFAFRAVSEWIILPRTVFIVTNNAFGFVAIPFNAKAKLVVSADFGIHVVYIFFVRSEAQAVVFVGTFAVNAHLM